MLEQVCFNPFGYTLNIGHYRASQWDFFLNITLGKIILFHWVQNKKRRKEIEEGIRFCLQQQI